MRHARLARRSFLAAAGTTALATMLRLLGHRVETAADGVRFRGAFGWIRRRRDGQVLAAVPDGDAIEAWGVRIEGRGPWTYNLDGLGTLDVRGPTPRRVEVR